jgi:signal peptidase I
MSSDSESGVPAPGAEPAAEPKKESWWSFLRFLLILFLATLVMRSCIAAPFSIPSASMLPSLMVGDYLFVSKWPYGYSRHSFPGGIVNFDGRIMENLPDRGDIVVFRHPGPNNEDWVKRVIGLPGDQIEVRGGELILNNQPVPRERIADFVQPVTENMTDKEPNDPCGLRGPDARETRDDEGNRICVYARYRETLPGGRSYEVLDQIRDVENRRSVGDPSPIGADNVAPFRVPEGHVFVMGDNRDDSLDGRFPVSTDPSRPGGVGMLPLENLQGRALISFFSTDGSAEWLLPWTWFTAARGSRIGMTYP